MNRLIILGILIHFIFAADLLPDLVTIRPTHLNIGLRRDGTEVLKFTNGIANIGLGRLEVESVFPPTQFRIGQDRQTFAIQNIYDEFRRIGGRHAIGYFEFHPNHNHYHVSAVSKYSIHPALDDGLNGEMGPAFYNGTKVTFCLLDSFPILPTARRPFYSECSRSKQGISPGYADQYGQGLPDQDLPITDIPNGLYYLVSESNPERRILETDYSNNVAWVSFHLGGEYPNRSIKLVSHSVCTFFGACGELTPDDGGFSSYDEEFEVDNREYSLEDFYLY